MTSNAALDDQDDPQSGQGDKVTDAKAVVRMIRDSWAVVAPHSEKVSQRFYGLLFMIAPATRDMFPANMEIQRNRLMHALVHIVQMIDRPTELTPFLKQLGRDHRKFDVISEHYEAVGTALLAAIKEYSGERWSTAVEQAWADAYAIIAEAMQEGMRTDAGPAWWPAKVVEHVRLDPETAVVRVETPSKVPYEPGQYVSVETPQRMRMWRYLSPANAPRQDNTIDFHIRTVDGGWVSRGIVGHTRVGDVWRIGAPLGNLWANPTADRPILMVAGGTGVAPMRAVIDALSRRDKRPEVTMFFGGKSEKYLYNLEELRYFADQHAWFSVNPVTDDGSLEDGMTGTLAEVVTSKGAWADHDVLVAGSPQMIRSTVSKMLVEGTPFDRISYDSFPTT